MTCTVTDQKLIVGDGTEELGYRDLCDVLSNEEIREVVLPETLRVIGENTFFDWPQIRKIHIPQNIQHIGTQAFWGLDELEELTLPCAVSFVGHHAFCNCGKLTLTIQGSAGEIPSGWDPEFAANIKELRFAP